MHVCMCTVCLHLNYFIYLLKDPEHDEVCNGGVARMAIRTGDIRR